MKERMEKDLAKSWRAWKRINGSKLLGPKAALNFVAFHLKRLAPTGEHIRIWQIGPDGTEYFAARSEEEMRGYYRALIGLPEADDDLRDYFEEVKDIDQQIQFNDDGAVRMVSFRKLAAEATSLPCQISTGYN